MLFCQMLKLSNMWFCQNMATIVLSQFVVILLNTGGYINLKHNLYEEKYLPKGSRKCIVSEKKFILKLRFRTLSRARPHIYIIHVYVFSA